MIGPVVEDFEEKHLPAADEIQMLASTTKGIDSLLLLINGLLEYLRTDAATQQNELVDLNDVIGKAIRSNKQQKDKSYSISIDVLPIVSGSTLQLLLLFKNRIANGIE